MKKIIGILLILPCLWSARANALLWRLGAVSENSLRIFATTGDTRKTVTVDVAGVGTFAVTESIWTDTSDGSPEDTYYAVIEVTGLQPWTTYAYTIYEDAVAAGTGGFRTLPGDTTIPFELALIGCNTARTDGLKDEIANRSYAKGGALLAIIHVDDIAYIDTRTVTNVEGITSTGKPRTTKLAYDYAAAWIKVLNNYDDHQNWISHNIPTFWMWGDHEVNNDFMTGVDAIDQNQAGTRAPGEHIIYDNRMWLAANAAYSKFALAAPDSFDHAYPANGVDGKTYAYGIDIGPVRFFIHDRNTAVECHDCVPDVQCPGKICGEIAGHQYYPENFGKTQLDHLKSWLDDASHPFKILFAGITIGGHSLVENQPWLSWWPYEYYDFESWLDSNPNLNGIAGNFLFVAGDRHNFAVHKRSKSAPVNGGANFMEYYVGTINGTSNHENVPTGEIQNGSEVIYSESGGVGSYDHWLTLLGVTETALKLTTLDKHHNEIFTGTLSLGAGNHFINMTPGLDVLNVAAPGNPSYAARTGFRGNKLDLLAATGYLARRWKGLQIIDITDPSAPSLIQEMDNIFAEDVRISSNKLYVAGGWSGLQILDGSNAPNPVLLASKNTIANRYAVDVEVDAGNRAYLAASGSPGLQVFDVNDPGNIQAIGWDELEQANGIAFKGDYVILASGSDGLNIISRAEPSVTTDVAAQTVQFSIPSHLPQGTYDITVINQDGSILKSKLALTINKDSDGDGLNDDEEINTYFTDPFDSDTDDDGISDGDEVNIYSTMPNLKDTDGDGAQDGLEVATGTNPLDGSSFPTAPDGDLDGDGHVDALDILLASQIALGLRVPTNYHMIHGDVSPLAGGIPQPDGNINASDILLVMRKAFNLAAF